jgi:hypothetical protein
MNWKKYILLLSGLTISNSSFGLDTLFINSGFRKVDMKLVSGVFWCSNSEVNIERVQELEKEIFIPLVETGIAFTASDKVYCVKTVIKNKDFKTRRFIVKVDNPRINKLQFFIIKDSINKASILMNNNFYFHQRKVKIEIFYIRLRSKLIKLLRSIFMRIRRAKV